MKYVSVDKEICYIANLIRKEFDNYSQCITGEERITRMNIWIIDYIYDKKGSDVFQKDIEHDLSITRSTASKIIDLMVQKNLIERSAVEYDARLKKLSLTTKAIQVHDNMEKCSKIVYDKVMDGFSKEEEKMLLSYILRIKKNMTCCASGTGMCK